MARYPGGQAVVYLSASGATAAVNVPNLTMFGIDTPRAMIDVTACNDANKKYVPSGIPDYGGKMDVWFDDTNTAALFTAATSSTACSMYCYPSANAAGRYFSGTAWVSVDNFQSGGIGGGAKLAISWKAAGTWAQTLA